MCSNFFLAKAKRYYITYWFDNEFCLKNVYIRFFLGTLVGKRKQTIFEKRWFDITIPYPPFLYPLPSPPKGAKIHLVLQLLMWDLDCWGSRDKHDLRSYTAVRSSSKNAYTLA
jgi:hypothetical protein